GLAFIVESLKKNKSASYADIKAAADKKKLKVWPIMYGRAKLLLGHVKGAKRGTGKSARAKAGTGIPAKRGPGRPRKNAHQSNGAADFDSIIRSVRSTQADVGRFRTVLERISGMVSDVLE